MSKPKVYQLPLDVILDKDILDRLDELPRARKAEWVRTAIRVYMAIEKGEGVTPVVAPFVPSIEEKPKEKKKPKDISFG